VICDYRPGAGIRLGPHFFTTDGELEHAIATIREVVASGLDGRRGALEARF
jgi:kynureninase